MSKPIRPVTSTCTFALLCFVFRLYAFVEALALRSIVLRYAGAPIATRVPFFFPFVYLEMSPFPSIFLYLPLVIEAAEQKYAHTAQFRYLGGLIDEDGELSQEINRRSRAAWVCIRRFSRELFDRPRAPWRLKVRLLRAEAMEALLYGCMTWAPAATTTGY